MITYKVTCLFNTDWGNLYKMLFGNSIHVASEVTGNVGTFSFDQPVTPADLGPLVRVELISAE